MLALHGRGACKSIWDDNVEVDDEDDAVPGLEKAAAAAAAVVESPASVANYDRKRFFYYIKNIL